MATQVFRGRGGDFFPPHFHHGRPVPDGGFRGGFGIGGGLFLPVDGGDFFHGRRILELCTYAFCAVVFISSCSDKGALWYSWVSARDGSLKTIAPKSSSKKNVAIFFPLHKTIFVFMMEKNSRIVGFYS